jgi:hypothetical protein
VGDVIAWAAFLGGWLLVAGPLFQGAVELREQGVDLAAMREAGDSVPPISPWWWLLPPVMYMLQRRRNAAVERATFDRLAPAERVRYVGFMNAAAGWFTVAAGALLIAAKETWELVEHNHWPAWVFAILMVVAAVLAILNMAVRMIRAERMRDPAFGVTPPAAPDDRSGR